MDGFGVGSPDRFAGYTHNHLAQAIGQLDTKVSILLGITSGALVYLVQNRECPSFCVSGERRHAKLEGATHD